MTHEREALRSIRLAPTVHDAGGVLGFAIPVIAFAFGGALGLPDRVRLLVIA
jgi:hypothetical protein